MTKSFFLQCTFCIYRTGKKTEIITVQNHRAKDKNLKKCEIIIGQVHRSSFIGQLIPDLSRRALIHRVRLSARRSWNVTLFHLQRIKCIYPFWIILLKHIAIFYPIFLKRKLLGFIINTIGYILCISTDKTLYKRQSSFYVSFLLWF